MDKDLEIYQEERPWGVFRKFTNNTLSTVKILIVKPNEQLSLQSHNERREFWRVIKGEGSFYINDKEISVSVGDEQYVPVGTKHQIKAGDEGIEVLEISLGHFNESDIIRYEDKYGRV